MRILIVDDDRVACRVLEKAVTAAGHDCDVAHDGKRAWARFQDSRYDVVVSDWYMPGVDGLELCRRVRSAPGDSYTYFILLTVADAEDNVQSAIREGVDDFLGKPLKPAELGARLVVAERIASLQRRAALADEKITLLEEQTRSREAFQGMIGKSPAMQEVFRRLRLAAESDVTVLLHGETGTGKELAARAIHALSERKDASFIGVNCGALPETILESELFGHVKGAFTGAVRDRAGLFQMARGGTLFLDEVGDVSPAMQTKLLRALEEREIYSVGDDRPTKIDARIVAATNRSLDEMVSDGSLRSDFYYRIRVFQIDLPPLRDRREDISLLLDHFVGQLGGMAGKKVRGMDPQARRACLDHDWPGNIRELRNAVERAMVTAEGGLIARSDLPAEIRHGKASDRPSADSALTPGQQEEKERILAALEQSGGVRTQAAEILGISRVTLWKKIRRLGIDASGKDGESQGAGAAETGRGGES